MCVYSFYTNIILVCVRDSNTRTLEHLGSTTDTVVVSSGPTSSPVPSHSRCAGSLLLACVLSLPPALVILSVHLVYSLTSLILSIAFLCLCTLFGQSTLYSARLACLFSTFKRHKGHSVPHHLFPLKAGILCGFLHFPF